MNKKIIGLLVAIMGISIVGIIIVQLVWMNNAIRVKNELFDRGVNEALITATNRLETMHDFRLINRFSFGDSMHFRGIDPMSPGPPNQPGRITKRIIAPKRSGNQHEQRIEMIVESGKNSNGIKYQISSKNNVSQKGKASEIIVLNTDSIEFQLDSIYQKGIHKFDSLAGHLTEWTDTVNGLRRRFEIKTNKLQRVANKFVQEISNWEENDVPIEQLSEVLGNELRNRNIPIPFELGIIKDSTISNKSAKADSLLLAASVYKVNLFPNNIIQKNIRLAVYFPEKDTFIYRTINWLLVISLLFSILILLTFATSVYFILKQKKISEMKTDFINNMTHEFKTPIATISVAADSIVNTKVIENPDRIRYFIGMIKKENARMNRQVEDILTIARLEKKEFDFKWECFDLHVIIEEAIQSILLQVEKKGGTITSEFNATNSMITSDPSHISNLISNLLDNANKYSPETPEIKISTKNTNQGILILIEDHGIGMSKSVQNRIFERFYRQTSGNIHNVKGFGLGLSYVKAVLEANQGKISVHSEPGKGSRFEAFLPFEITEAKSN